MRIFIKHKNKIFVNYNDNIFSEKSLYKQKFNLMKAFIFLLNIQIQNLILMNLKKEKKIKTYTDLYNLFYNMIQNEDDVAKQEVQSFLLCFGKNDDFIDR